MEDQHSLINTSSSTLEPGLVKTAALPSCSPRRILVVNAYVRENAGDAALLSVLLKQASAAFPQCEMIVTGMDDPAQYEDFEGHAYIGSLRRWIYDEKIPRWRRMVRSLLGDVVALCWFRGPRVLWSWLEWLLPLEPRREISMYRRVDLVLGLGGGYMQGANSLQGDLHVFYALMPLALAKRLHLPVVLAPQSYGPFGNQRQIRAVVRVLHNLDAVFVREDVSMKLLTSLGASPKVLRRAVDSGFAFESQSTPVWQQQFALDPATTLVGMTARRWLQPAAQAQYERALSLTAKFIHSSGFQVVLVPQVTARIQQDDDRVVQSRIAAQCTSERLPIHIVDLSGYGEVKALYTGLHFHIGTRFHSVIFALTSFVPCIAIEYEYKTGGIMRELGLERWVIPIAEVTPERLQALFSDLVREAETYRAYLHQVIPQYIDRSREFISFLQQMENWSA